MSSMPTTEDAPGSSHDDLRRKYELVWRHLSATHDRIFSFLQDLMIYGVIEEPSIAGNAFWVVVECLHTRMPHVQEHILSANCIVGTPHDRKLMTT